MKKGLIVLMSVFTCLSLVGCDKKDKKDNNTGGSKTSTIEKVDYNDYKISSNSVGDFDLFFLKNDTKTDQLQQNRIYSPLSIKFALEMLEEGANGETKTQISNIIGSYNTKKYDNNANMSFANALFIRDSYKDNVKSSYSELLKTKYNADVVYDSFTTAENINKWVSDKTFNLINDLVSDTSEVNFVLVNALAIDMKWVNRIQTADDPNGEGDYSAELWNVNYFINHIDFDARVDAYDNFENPEQPAEIGAVANKYDIVKTLGKDKIKETVREAYAKWLADPNSESCLTSMSEEPDVDTYINNTITEQYFNEMNEAYGTSSYSTDFEFYDDENVKVFAKDLKEYNGTTLQYVGIMPKNKDLDKYIEEIKASDINDLISKLRTMETYNFKEGVITYVTGYIPVFKFDYELDLVDELKVLGVTDIFDSEKADLSNLTTDKQFIGDATHKATIEFTNEGITAAAASAMGGYGAGDCGFEYYFEPPIEIIDLTFNKPFMFLIRDKYTGEVWFVGSNYTDLADQTEYVN